MKEKLYTIPLNDAVNAADECPLCFALKEIEDSQLEYVLGSCASYMESDTRDMTDKAGFCRRHFKDMYDYGNTLGNGWILKTHYLKVIDEMDDVFKKFTPSKTSLKDRISGKKPPNPLVGWLREKESSCFICKQVNEMYDRYVDTFFYLYKNDKAFKGKITEGKGFCLPHFADLCEAADEKMSDKELSEFYDLMKPLMINNMKRIQGDISWFVDKFSYENRDKDWKNSRDAVQRGMQKLKGGYPAASKLKNTKQS